MDRDGIPDDVSRFVLLAIPSVPYLEATLLMRREHAQPWDCKRLAERIYVSDKAAQSVLSDLHAQGILSIVDPALQRYEYKPSSAELAQMIDRVAEIYSKNLIGITNLIHAKTSRKARQFADAFIWRKDV